VLTEEKLDDVAAWLEHFLENPSDALHRRLGFCVSNYFIFKKDPSYVGVNLVLGMHV
jgi:hypothetical protein